MPKIKSRSSRRAPPLKDADYDHEISLVDNAAVNAGGDEEDAGQRHLAPSAEANTSTVGGDAAADDNRDDANRRSSAHLSVPGTGGATLSPVKSTASSTDPLLPTMSSVPTATAETGSGRSSSRGRSSARYGNIAEVAVAPSNGAPAVEIEAAADNDAPNGSNPKGKEQQQPQQPQPGRPSMQSSRSEAESAIDILYENERGGFLCGIPLFSGRALGGLDPSPWTNYVHKTSPTDIHTAQVPDPSWEWAWPEWRINHGDGTDDDGWLYSFMFAKCSSWHGPKWYNSFVRRRAWIRRRVKRRMNAASAAASAVALGEIDSVTDPHLLNPEYFTVVPAASMRRSSSRTSSRLGSRASLAAASTSQASRAGAVPGGDQQAADEDEGFEMPAEIADADVLMRFLRGARIDREKIEAVQNFLDHAGEDLVRLQDLMHEIMALFVFQASRRALLTLLIEAHDQAVETKNKMLEEAASAEQQRNGEAATAPEGDIKTTETNNAAGAENGKGKTEADKEQPDDQEQRPGETGQATFPPNEASEDATHKLQTLERRVDYLAAAVQHADEEVRRLEYWSDIKAMARAGNAEGAVDDHAGWDANRWQGVDRSGPAPPRPDSAKSTSRET